MNDWGLFYQKYQNELSWAGGNLNQSVKRANELAVAGLLTPSYIQEVLLPIILETQDTLLTACVRLVKKHLLNLL